jgi:hypothetical protein
VAGVSVLIEFRNLADEGERLYVSEYILNHCLDGYFVATRRSPLVGTVLTIERRGNSATADMIRGSAQYNEQDYEYVEMEDEE